MRDGTGMRCHSLVLGRWRKKYWRVFRKRSDMLSCILDVLGMRVVRA